MAALGKFFTVNEEVMAYCEKHNVPLNMVEMFRAAAKDHAKKRD